MLLGIHRTSNFELLGVWPSARGVDPQNVTLIKIENETQLKRQVQNGGNIEKRDLKNLGKNAKTQAKSVYFRDGQIPAKHRLAENREKKRPDGEPPNGAKVENRDLKKWKDTKKQAKSGYFRTGQKSEKHRWPKIAEKNGPTASPKMGPKSKIEI